MKYKIQNLIDDIPSINDQILESASKGKLVIFVGAGVSRIIGCPSWEKFAFDLLDDLFTKREINYFEKKELSKLQARKILSICVDIYRDKNIYPPDYQKIFTGDPELKKRFNLYEDLYKFNVIYVTTNYDDHLDREAETAKPKEESMISSEVASSFPVANIEKGNVFYKREELLISNLSNGNVLHIHGSIREPEQMIITLVDYMNQYRENSLISVFLEELFTKYIVLFIGYGLEEYEILDFMISKIKRKDRNISHFILLPFYKSQKNIVEFQKKYYLSMGIKLMPYFIDNKGHMQLAFIIKDWAEIIGRNSKPQSPLDTLRIIDEVL